MASATRHVGHDVVERRGTWAVGRRGRAAISRVASGDAGRSVVGADALSIDDRGAPGARRGRAARRHDQVAAGGDRREPDARRRDGGPPGRRPPARPRRAGRRRAAPDRARRRAALRARSSTVAGGRVGRRPLRSPVARSAPWCGEPRVTSRWTVDRERPGALGVGQGEPGDDAALGVGDDVDRDARVRPGRPRRGARRGAGPTPRGRPGCRSRRRWWSSGRRGVGRDRGPRRPVGGTRPPA